jgi:N4-gp56 family major capsid protein
MADEILVETTSSDQESFLVTELLSNAWMALRCKAVLDEVTQPKGTGETGTFVRYVRMNLPTSTLSEFATPDPNTFTVETVTYTLDYWGDYVLTSTRVHLTTKHPLMDAITRLLADSAQRLIDREVQIVWLAGTNIQYGDGTVTARSSITSSMTMDHTVYSQAYVTLVEGGARPRGGPTGTDIEVGGEGSSTSLTGAKHFVAFCGPQVIKDLQTPSTSFGTWASVMTYNNPEAVYAGEQGMIGDIRFIETNFIPRFKLLGGTTEANVSGTDDGTNTPVVTAVNGGGSLTSSTTYFYKVTRKNLLYGFEEDISIAHSMASAATGDNESFTFDFSSLTAGFVYNLYFDKTQAGGTSADSNLGLVSENIAVGTTVTVTTVATSSTTPPGSTGTAAGTQTIHPVYIIGADFCSYVGFKNLKTYVSGDEVTVNDPLKQRKSVGYDMSFKAVIKNQDYMLRVEVVSTFASSR